MVMLLRRGVLLQMDSTNTLHQLPLNSTNVIMALLLNPFQTILIMSKTLVNLVYSIYLSECSLYEEIKEIIKELSPNKASDRPITVLKRISTITSPILANFYNAFMSSGTFPNVLKTGIVSPVYKKGNPQQFDNYRPISTLSIFSKLLEKLIYIRIYSFLIAKKILYEKQFGFRKNHSTSHAINHSIKYVTDNIEQKKHVIGNIS